MNRRRRWAAAGAAVLLAITAGCRADDDTPTADDVLDGPISTRPPETTTEPVADDAAIAAVPADPWLLATEPLVNAAGPPRMLVSDGDVITRIDRGVAVVVADPERRVGAAGGIGDGTIVYEELETDDDGIDTSVRLVRLDPDGATSAISTGAHRSVELHDLVRTADGAGVLYTRFRDPTDVDDEVTGVLVFLDLATGDRTALGDAAGPGFFVSHASGAGDAVVVTATADLTEVVSFVDWAGTPIDRPSPTDDLAYGQPPFVTSAVLSPDGAELATVEGPDAAGDDGTALVGDWEVVVDDVDGEQLRLTMADTSIKYVEIDFDGRWLLVSGGDAAGPVAPLLIDTEATDLATYLVDGVAGLGQLESAAVIAPA